MNPYPQIGKRSLATKMVPVMVMQERNVLIMTSSVAKSSQFWNSTAYRTELTAAGTDDMIRIV